MPKFSFLPREEKFADLFQEGARILVQEATLLNELMNNWASVQVKVKEIDELEHEADTIVHRAMSQLHSTFVTPFDREDIAALAHSLDDVVDFVQAAVDAMLVYRVDGPTPRAKELSGLILEAAKVMEKAMPYLKHKSRLNELLAYCVELNRLENAADTVYRAALGELFSDTTNVVDIIKWREIYEHLESATDRCEDVANVLEGIVVKNA